MVPSVAEAVGVVLSQVGAHTQVVDHTQVGDLTQVVDPAAAQAIGEALTPVVDP